MKFTIAMDFAGGAISYGDAVKKINAGGGEFSKAFEASMLAEVALTHKTSRDVSEWCWNIQCSAPESEKRCGKCRASRCTAVRGGYDAMYP